MNNAIVLTGVRPTSNLTIANYIGAIRPILDFQAQNIRPFVFVADLHALTDNEPEILKYSDEILFDFLAAGVDPAKTVMYKQSTIAKEIGYLVLLLSRHVSVAELIKLPTLKEKIKGGNNVENANALLALYPVMMAADILIQRAEVIPVGKDQESHIEITKKIARRFNEHVGEVFPVPRTHIMEMVKILSLRGLSKMSKSSPEDAIFLTDDIATVKKKINRAETAEAGKMSDNLKSHITLIKSICRNVDTLTQLDNVIERHEACHNVMKDFKEIFEVSVIDFLQYFQEKRKEIMENKTYYNQILLESSEEAINRARQTMDMVSHLFVN